MLDQEKTPYVAIAAHGATKGVAVVTHEGVEPPHFGLENQMPDPQDGSCGTMHHNMIHHPAVSTFKGSSYHTNFILSSYLTAFRVIARLGNYLSSEPLPTTMFLLVLGHHPDSRHWLIPLFRTAII